MTESKEVTIKEIKSKIISLPGRPDAMLAQDLAPLYKVEPKVLNQAVRRNKDRFPEDFMFQATKEEFEILRSQSVTSESFQGVTTYMPYLFTQAGANMLSGVLKSKVAIERSIQIVRAFTEIEKSAERIGEGPKLITQKTVEVTKSTLEIAKLYGLEGNQALLSTNRTVAKLTGINCMELLEINGLENKEKKQYLTPTILGKSISISARQFNKKLEEFGFQKSGRDHTGRLIWIVTEKGKPYCQMIDIGKKRNPNGAPVLQVKWTEDILNFFSGNREVA